MLIHANSHTVPWCMGGETKPQPAILRLILNAAALAAASPTLLFKFWYS
jgi:hypothetical protein